MDYVIKNHKNVYIKLNRNGTAITCPESEKGVFEEFKAKNIIGSLPKALKRLNFRVEPIPDVGQNKKIIEEKDDKREEYILSENITRWVEKFGKCGDILSEAEERENQLLKDLKYNDKELIDILHIIEIEKLKDMFSGWQLYRSIRNNRIKIRSMKDEILIVENVLGQIKNISCLHREKIQKSIDGLFTRKYTFRIVEEEETENVV